MTKSILGRVTPDNVHSDPFPYILTTEALDPDYYEELAAHYPDFSGHPGASKNNVSISMSGLHAFSDEIPLHPIWKEFMAFHYSGEFLQQVISTLGDLIPESFPDLETQLGKKLEDVTVIPRHIEGDADVEIHVPFRVNTPVNKASRVRSKHVDSPKKLFNGLFYFRAPEDDCIGGDLEICRWKNGRRFNDVFVEDGWADVDDIVPYRANTFILFLNTPDSVHGVTMRMPTPHFRRYIAFTAEFKQPVYDLDALQDNSTPWALTLGANNND